MLRIMEAPDLGEDGDGRPWSMLHELRVLIRCEAIESGSFDATQRIYCFDQGPDTDDVFRDLFLRHVDIRTQLGRIGACVIRVPAQT
jgi:hypothetical protein